MRISMVIDQQNDFDEIDDLFKEHPIFGQMQLTASAIYETYSEVKVLFR